MFHSHQRAWVLRPKISALRVQNNATPHLRRESGFARMWEVHAVVPNHICLMRSHMLHPNSLPTFCCLALLASARGGEVAEPFCLVTKRTDRVIKKSESLYTTGWIVTLLRSISAPNAFLNSKNLPEWARIFKQAIAHSRKSGLFRRRDDLWGERFTSERENLTRSFQKSIQAYKEYIDSLVFCWT